MDTTMNRLGHYLDKLETLRTWPEADAMMRAFFTDTARHVAEMVVTQVTCGDEGWTPEASVVVCAEVLQRIGTMVREVCAEHNFDSVCERYGLAPAYSETYVELAEGAFYDRVNDLLNGMNAGGRA